MKNITQYLLFLLTISFTQSTLLTQTQIPPGPVAGTWVVSGSPYQIGGDITIADGSSLTIEAGVVVQFTGPFGLVAAGQLTVQGTQSAPVQFQVEPGGITDFWKGIELLPATGIDSTIIHHAVFTDARRGDSYPLSSFEFEDAGGALRIVGRPAVRVSNCLFTNNWSAFSGPAVACLDGADIVFANNEVRNNLYGSRSGGVEISNSRVRVINNEFSGNNSLNGHCLRIVGEAEETVIRGNLFENNGLSGQQSFGGSVFIDFNGSATIERNTFRNNSTQDAGGAIFANFGQQSIIANNWFEGNAATGDGVNDPNDFAQASSGAVLCVRCKVLNNVFVDNFAFWGGALHLVGFAEASNNLFYNNFASVSGGALLLSGPENDVSNNIFWANSSAQTGQQITIGGLATDFRNNLIQAGEGGLHEVIEFTNGMGISEYENNIIDFPAFEDPDNFNFYPQPNSPLIDAGTTAEIMLTVTDYNGNARIVGPAIDIGPYEFDPTSAINRSSLKEAEIKLYPNPATDIVRIELPAGTESGIIEISLIDAQGRLTAHWERSGQPGTCSLILPAGLDAGVYAIQVSGRGFQSTATLLTIK